MTLRPAADGAEAAATAPGERAGTVPLSPGQRQMWVLNRMNPSDPLYLVPWAVRITGPLDVEAMRRAWEALVHRHGVLRTRYVPGDPEPGQIVDPPGRFDLRVVDVRGASAREAREASSRLLEREASTGMDLTAGHPLRVTLVREGEGVHLLVAVLHHIACDEASQALLARELGALYGEFAHGEPAGLVPSPLQYADYAAGFAARVAGGGLDGGLAHWLAELDGLENLELPLDRPRPAVRDARGAAVEFGVPADVAEGVGRLARAERVSPFIVFLAAYHVLLSRYCATADVPVGTVVSNRVRPELEHMLGYAVNSLIVRARCTPAASFTAFLAEVRRSTLGAFDHREVPFEWLVDRLRPDRDLSMNPLFQAAFTLHESGGAAPVLPGLGVEPVRVSHADQAKFDLALQLAPSPGEVRGWLQYAVALFDRGTAERMAADYVRLLDRIVRDPHASLADLRHPLDAELPALIVPPLDPEAAARRPGGTLQAAFEEQAARTPDAVAVVCGAESLTYAELNARANRLAHHLLGRGAGPETVVAVLLERGCDLLTAIVGVLKTGAAYLPVDPGQPADRIGYILSDSDAFHLVTSRSLADGQVFPAELARTVLDEDRALIEAQSPDDPVRGDVPGSLAYVIYTSGSTGRPKGVCVGHDNALRLLAVCDRHFGFAATDVFTMCHSQAFDVSVYEIWGALLHGGRLVVVPAGDTRVPERVLDVLIRERVTVLSQTPSAFRGLSAAVREAGPAADALNLRAVVFAGERLDVHALRPWTDRFGFERPRLINMYGITETTVHTTYHELSRRDLDSSVGSPVGRPLDDLAVHLLDEHGSPVPLGARGEIHVSGPGVARCYLGRPDLTAGRFLPDPFGPPGSRMYRSGDIARRRADGSLEYLGRIDDQIQLRGYRIELGEVEAAFAAHPDIAQAAVVVRHDDALGDSLVGYACPEAEAGIDAAEVRRHLARLLPGYMVPRTVVVLPALPLTANGKLDRRALPAVEEPARGTGPAPRFANPLEERLAEAWRQVLGHDGVGPHDGFFDAGGDSLRAVALAGMLRADGLDVTVQDVFEHRTIAALAGAVAGRPALARAVPLVEPFALLGEADRERVPDGVADAYPLSRVQAGMLVEMLAHPGENLYHNVTSFRVKDGEPLSEAALLEAARTVVRRHEALRTAIHLTGYSAPVQLVHREAVLTVPVTRHADIGPGDWRPVLEDYAHGERQRLFDLERPPLIRLHAHTSSSDPDGWWLSVTECHALLEGWGFHSLLMEFLTCYRELRAGGAPAVTDDVRVRYADFVAAELTSLASVEDRDHWRRVIGSGAPARLPAAWRGDPLTRRERYREFVSYEDLTEPLRALAARTGTSMKAVLLAAHVTVMRRITEEPSCFVGLVCDTRPEIAGADRVLGMYLNTVPFTVPGDRETWEELVEEVFRQEVELWPHRRYPMPAMQQEFGRSERLIDIMFNYLDFHQVDHELIEWTSSVDDSPNEFGLAVVSNSGHLMLASDTHTLGRPHAARLAALYRAVLEAMASGGSGAGAAHLPPGEADLVLAAGNGGAARGLAGAPSAYAAFARQADATPGAVAVTSGDTRLTYRELRERVDALAGRLAGAGVAPGTVVGVLLERTALLPVVLLALWRAGAAYLPLDPALPVDRMRFMTEDAGIRLLVAQEALVPLASQATDAPVFVADGDAGSPAAGAEPAGRNAPGGPHQHGLAYVIYTSGSTGTPKGVQVPHDALTGLLAGLAAELTSGADDVWLFSTSLSFDISTVELFLPLVTGGTVVVGPVVSVGSRDALLRLVHTAGVTHAQTTPSAWRILLDGGLAAPGLTALAGGEELSPELAGRLLRHTGRLVNVYGPTEATVWCTIRHLAPGAPDVTIGRPLPGYRTLVLDRGMRPVPLGVPGELHVGGVGVARGYTNRPELTAERFVPDPHGPAGARLYRTGDLVRLREDGELEFLGRTDWQIKLRGHRIEPGEINTHLRAHPGVRDSHVMVREDTPGDRRLVAYLLVEPGRDVDLAVLRKELGRRLPVYMLPASYVPVTSWPLSGAGKLAVGELPAPAGDAPGGPGPDEDHGREPRAVLCRVFAAVLGVAEVGPDDDFFDLGGHSLLVLELASRIEDEFGAEVDLLDLLDAPTPRGVAARLTTAPSPDPRETPR